MTRLPAICLAALLVASPAGAQEIRASNLTETVRTLASDQFQGRAPGTVGEERTIGYLIGRLQALGLEPAGTNGGWTQPVPLLHTALGEPSKLAFARGGATTPLVQGTDIYVSTLQPADVAAVANAPLVFVGYGVTAPERGWDDFKGADLKGKVAVFLINDPDFVAAKGEDSAGKFGGRTMTYYGRWTYKFEEAARRGAAAAFIVHDTEAAGYGWDVVQSSWSGPQFDLPAEEDPAPRLDVAGWISGEAAHRLFAQAGLDFEAARRAADQRGFKPIALPAKASIVLHSTIKRGSSDNVIGMLRGSKRPDEAIVYSAHWDHLGRDASLSGDPIFNGAIDNATGVAGLIEIAEAFVHQQPAPERTIVFAAVTLEESGLLGSKYYVAHPPFALADTVADITMDAMPLIGRAHDMNVIGYGQSELDRYLAGALTAQGRHIAPDDAPEKGRFFRSDHFSFARRGVPALYVKGGVDLRNGGVAAGKAAVDDYTRHRYHKPSDEFRADFQFDGVIEDLQALYTVGQRLGSETTWPQWSLDSEFRAAREAMPGR